ncbi:class I SAM-dependent methyltransferase [Streptomyces sp. NPDC001599]|uniref:class I SAM-dependent methyltransferase n=1 Tax=Streptomyces sp. NPDC001599 TaxID=3364591 RepID=UPI0036885AD0
MMRTVLAAAHRSLHRIAEHRHPSPHRGTGPDPGGMGISGEAYDRLSGRLLSGLYRHAATETCRAPRAGVAVDIGTGPGRLLLRVARSRPDLTLHGVDISPSMVRRARHNAERYGLGNRITVHLADGTGLPLPDACADVVVSTLSMHHWSDTHATVAEAARVLRPGGRLVVFDFRSVSDAPLRQGVAARPEFRGQEVSRSLVTGAPWLPFPLFARLTVRSGVPGEGGD